jgi:hypothetical protein
MASSHDIFQLECIIYYVTKFCVLFDLKLYAYTTYKSGLRPHSYSEQPDRNNILNLFVLWIVNAVFNCERVSER